MSLGDSSDERTLAALLDALSGSAEQLNNPMAVNSQLTTSVDKLDAIIEEMNRVWEASKKSKKVKGR